MNRTISFKIIEGRLPFCIGNSLPNTGINSIFLPLLGWFLLFPSTISLKVDIVAPRVSTGSQNGWMNYCRRLGKKVEGK